MLFHNTWKQLPFEERKNRQFELILIHNYKILIRHRSNEPLPEYISLLYFFGGFPTLFTWPGIQGSVSKGPWNESRDSFWTNPEVKHDYSKIMQEQKYVYIWWSEDYNWFILPVFPVDYLEYRSVDLGCYGRTSESKLVTNLEWVENPKNK